MWFSRRKKKEDDSARIDAEVRAINDEMIRKIDTASLRLKEVNDLFQEPTASALIFWAMGGKRRRDGKY